MLTEIKTKNSNLNVRLGDINTYKNTSHGLEAFTNQGSFKVTVYTDNIIKVHVTKDEEYDESSYAVIKKPEAVDFLIKDSDNQIEISTSQVTLIITKSNVSFSFLTSEGHIINEDDKAFGTSWLGEQVSCYKKLQDGERFIGLGEKTGPLDRRGNGYQNWNTDHFGYPVDSDPLYCSTPFYIGVHNKLSYGIFFDNSHKSHFNFGASNNRFSSFSADQGDMCYYFIHHDKVEDIISSYAQLTGTMELPPMWSLGYQQCRYSYYPDKKVLNIAQTFRDKDIPADVIVLDIHYMERYKIFTWDKKGFPNPKAMIEELKKQGFHVVVICDPGIKIENGYDAYDDGMKKDVFVKYPDGENYEGEVWPGWCHFPDFTKPSTREWWGEQLKAYTNLGIEGFWNDMNEIATWGQTLPELMEFDFDGDSGSTRKARNVYGMQMARSTYEGAKKNIKNKRVFNLTRAGFSGVQRYGAIWTGDNLADDEHMLLGVRLVNSLGLTGVPFAGYDIGGFAGNADENLFARWISIGAFSPFFRGHSMINSRDSEPWAYGEEVEEISRNYIKLRYKLMPYIYTHFHKASESGVPVSRSLAVDYTHDSKIYEEDYQNQYLFGTDILVAPAPSSATISKTYFPEGKWYDFYTDNVYQGKQEAALDCPVEKLPVFVKESAIIPMQESVSSLSDNTNCQLQIHIYHGIEANTVEYYEDDGKTFEHLDGHFYKREITYAPFDNKLVLNAKEGEYNSLYTSLKIYFHGFGDQLAEQVSVQGKDVKVKSELFRHIEPISNFDPFGGSTRSDFNIQDLPYIILPNDDSEIKINW